MPRPRTTSDEAILHAAGRAIAEHGPGGLTLAAVAREAGLSAPTLVQRFGSKRGLLLAVAERAAHDVGELFDRVRGEHPSPLAALHAALGELAGVVESPRQLANSLGFLQLDLTDPDFRAHAAAHADRMLAEITASLTEAVGAGELTGDPARMARSVQIAYNGILIVWALHGNGPLTDTLRAEIDHLLTDRSPA
ncbi:TetR/AcrR family transcriptional regulator [Amycolatopsis suaedae]|uniref:TetR/AcrR family transcriptional regulator n=1 Tax=Amycolatopsis suaedae TaxID=2510978 RepID=A0A4Q7J982_9PSEU|nr:TetR/AcrR family transcriptional regulator [Amycolatopsis suaedae]RZQ63442.1 TetR/AcrR family transcriptional regulator [Amycolatopsis suaedae]